MGIGFWRRGSAGDNYSFINWGCKGELLIKERIIGAKGIFIDVEMNKGYDFIILVKHITFPIFKT